MSRLYSALSVISALLVGTVLAFLFAFGLKTTARDFASIVYSLWSPAEIRSTETATTTAPTTRVMGQKAVEELIPKTGGAIFADLKNMKLSLYENGVITKTYPIIAKGREGSPWETPPGQYSVLRKESIHFSSIGEVYMPFSMQFFGNYFIHGVPFYAGGKEVAPGYSGGCIRLATIDMKDLFERSIEKMPVFVSDVPDQNPHTGSYQIDASYISPISSQSALIADLDTGEVIWEKDAQTVRPMASLTKLLTALTSLEAVNQFQNAKVSARAVETLGDSDFKTGDKVAMKDLLYALLLESSNDASEIIAEHIGRSYFLALMRSKIAAIGLENTRIADPSGISALNVSTADDLFSLAQYIFFHKKYILDVTKTSHYQTTHYRFANNSKFFADPGYIGGKNGYTTPAQHTLVALYSLPLGEFSKRNIAIVLLNGDNKESDARALLSFLAKGVVYKGGDTQIPIANGTQTTQ